MTKEHKPKNEGAVALGRIGGTNTSKKHGKEFYIRISAMGKEVLRKKKLDRETASFKIEESTDPFKLTSE